MHLQVVLQFTYSRLSIRGDQIYTIGLDDLFACMFKIHGDLEPDNRLDLPQSPIGTVRVADKVTRLQEYPL